MSTIMTTTANPAAIAIIAIEELIGVVSDVLVDVVVVVIPGLVVVPVDPLVDVDVVSVVLLVFELTVTKTVSVTELPARS
jgi:hypothetical protein